jgi:hypothetical protein
MLTLLLPANHPAVPRRPSHLHALGGDFDTHTVLAREALRALRIPVAPCAMRRAAAGDCGETGHLRRALALRFDESVRPSAQGVVDVAFPPDRVSSIEVSCSS